MKTFNYLCLLMALVAGLAACDEVADIQSPGDFNLQADKDRITASDSTLNFTFEGKPDYLVFFSGEKGHKYINRNRGKIEVSSAVLNFGAAINYGLYDSSNPSVKLKISTDFNGKTEDIEKATWTDISSHFTWPAAKNGAFTPTPSGNMDLREYIGQPFHLAFYYYEENDGKQSFNTWSLPQLNVDVESEIDGHIAVANIYNVEYKFIKISGSVVYNAGANRIQGGAASTNTNEAWLVTRKMDATSVSPDTGVSLKEFTDSRGSYSYTYPYSQMEPGTYTITFVARNANIHDSKEVVRELTFTVE